MNDDDLYRHLRRILERGPCILRLRSGRSFRSTGLKWGIDEEGYYAELPVSDFVNPEGDDPTWGFEWARLCDILEITEDVDGVVLYSQEQTLP